MTYWIGAGFREKNDRPSQDWPKIRKLLYGQSTPANVQWWEKYLYLLLKAALIDLFGHLGPASCKHNTDIKSLYEAVIVNVLAKRCLFIHPADMEQH